MKQKLTKNDSMTSVYRDVSTLVEKFEQLLRSYNVYHIYYATFYEQHADELCSNLCEDWRNWADNVNPKYWLSHIKDCDTNPNRLIDWHKINYDWQLYIEQDINK